MPCSPSALRNRPTPPRARRCSTLAYGPVRFEKPSERLRAGRAPARGLSFVAVEDGRVIGTVRLWEVSAGPACPALLLGPLAVDPAQRRRGIGSALMRHALARRRPARPSRRAAGRRRGLLRPLRLLGRADRRAVAAGPRRPAAACSAANSSPARSTACGARSGRRRKPARTPLLAAVAGLRRPARASGGISPTTNVVDAARNSARRVFRPSALADKTPASGVATQWPTTPSSPLRRPDRHDRLRLDRPRHPAAAGAAHRVRPLEVRGDRPGRHRPQAARRAQAQVHEGRPDQGQLPRGADPAAQGRAGPRHDRQRLGRHLLGRPDGALQGHRLPLHRHRRRAVAGLLRRPEDHAVAALELCAARARARPPPQAPGRRHRR